MTNAFAAKFKRSIEEGAYSPWVRGLLIRLSLPLFHFPVVLIDVGFQILKTHAITAKSRKRSFVDLRSQAGAWERVNTSERING